MFIYAADAYGAPFRRLYSPLDASLLLAPRLFRCFLITLLREVMVAMRRAGNKNQRWHSIYQ